MSLESRGQKNPGSPGSIKALPQRLAPTLRLFEVRGEFFGSFKVARGLRGFRVSQAHQPKLWSLCKRRSRQGTRGPMQSSEGGGESLQVPENQRFSHFAPSMLHPPPELLKTAQTHPTRTQRRGRRIHRDPQKPKPPTHNTRHTPNASCGVWWSRTQNTRHPNPISNAH